MQLKKIFVSVIIINDCKTSELIKRWRKGEIEGEGGMVPISAKYKKIYGISKIPLDWHEHDKGDGCIRFHGSNKILHKYLLQFGKAKKKFIPREILDLSNRQINVFLDAFCMGDGHRLKDGSRHYYTSSKRLADDLLECIFKSGTAGTLIQRERKKKYHPSFYRVIESHETYEVHESLVSLTPKISHLRDKARADQMWIEQYDGNVYCVEVLPSHLLYVRRNGRSVWCGNSGTTAIVARALDRDWVGIELNGEYIKIAHKRLKEWPKDKVLDKLNGKSNKKKRKTFKPKNDKSNPLI